MLTCLSAPAQAQLAQVPFLELDVVLALLAADTEVVSFPVEDLAQPLASSVADQTTSPEIVGSSLERSLVKSKLTL
jgi:hypothetical protein